MADYYVSNTGADSAAGTIASPFKTIGKASTTAKAGDRVIVRGGTYAEVVRLTTSGTASAPIQYLAFPGEIAIIEGKNTANATDLVTITGNYVVLSGFVIQNAKRSGVSIWGAQHVSIQKNTIWGCTRGAIWMGYSNRTQSQAHLVEDNTVYQNCLENAARTRASGWPRAIAVDASDNTIVRRNRVYQNYGEGIGALSTSGTQILDNQVYDNFSAMIYLDNAPASVVKGNFIFDTGNSGFYRSGKPAVSALVANEATSYVLASSNITVSGNTIGGLAAPYYDGSYGVGGGLTGSSALTPNKVYTSA